MRIASSTIFTNAVAAISQQQNIIAQDQQQVSTGSAINSPQDDPFASATSVILNQEISRINDFTQSRSSVESNLNQLGTVLTSVTSTLQSVSQNLVQAGSPTLSASDRKSLATQLQGSLDSLVSYANIQDGNGNYIFSGYQTFTQPFDKGNYLNASPSLGNAGSASVSLTNASMSAPLQGNATITINSYTPADTTTSPTTPQQFTYSISGLPNSKDNVTNASSDSNGLIDLTAGGVAIGTLSLSGTPQVGDSFSLNPTPVVYRGDQGARTVQVNDGQFVSTTLVGTDVFGSIPTGNGSFATASSASNTGSGVISPGSVVSSSALTGNQYAITFSGSPGQVTAGNQNTGAASYNQGSATGTPSNNDQYNVVFSVSGGQTQYTIADLTTGSTSDASNYINGVPISLPNGATFSISGNPAAGDSFAYVPGPATTYSVQNLTTGQPVPGHTNVSYISGNAIQFDGMSLTITGSPSSNDTFTVNPSTTTDVFTVIQNAINALTAPAGSSQQSGSQLTNALSIAQQGISGALNQVDIGQSSVGGRTNLLTSLDSTTALIKISLQKQLSTLTNTDLAAAISDLSQATVSLTAAQKAFVQVQGLNLFSFIQ